MSSSFFTVPGSQRKRKRTDTATRQSSKRHQPGPTNPRAKDGGRPERTRQRSEDISGSESDVSAEAAEEVEPSGSESGDEDETGAERRLRLAERYLNNLKREVEIPEGFDAAEIDRDLIAERLKEDIAESKGKVYKHIAKELDWQNASKTTFTADQDGVTGAAASPPYAYTVSKDGSVAKWEVVERELDEAGETKRPTNIAVRHKPKFLRSYRSNRSKARDAAYIGHTSSILCCAASADGKFLVTGGADKRIVVWDVQSEGPKTLKPIKVFTQHRDSILGLAFRRSTNQLFSASADRTIRTWSLDSLGYIETLFGHQDHVTDIAGLPGEMCVSVGSRDRTARLWKVVEESQLVFRGGGGGGSASAKKHKSAASELHTNGELPPGDAEPDEDDPLDTNFEEHSVDAVAIIDTETFVTGSDNGSLSLWSIHRKKPVFTLPLAHGADPRNSPRQSYNEHSLAGRARQGRAKPRWITALATLPFSDVLLSGSWDGCVRAWRADKEKRRIEPLGVVGRLPEYASTGGRAGREFSATGEAASPAAAPALAQNHSVRGVVTSLTVFPRAEGGIAVLASVSKHHRLGAWKPVERARNGAVLFEVRMRGERRGAGGTGSAGQRLEDGGADDEAAGEDAAAGTGPGLGLDGVDERDGVSESTETLK